ncbi:MAG: hypothetical protein AUK44_05130 [Porphyromonadaceae bacterium CG2_30_38_12]|nr:MAG: hypothetical protein AUK44_05130 [Porphyromonadaceae bacterium CG2_30_38_12]
MKNLPTNIRIKDIARLAGVSEGTVDRVLHNRGEVSKRSKEAVSNVLDQIDYSPNVVAQALASKKKYRFVYLIPHNEMGNYWTAVLKGFQLAAAEYAAYNVSFNQVSFNQFDAQSYTQAIQSILQDLPDAAFIAPIFRDETLEFTRALKNSNIPFSFIDSKIDEVDFLTYYGQNSLKSGYIAAKFLLSDLQENKKIFVVRTKRNGAVSNQTLNRLHGFMQYLTENKPAWSKNIIPIELFDDDEAANLQILREATLQYPDLAAVITFNSKVYRLASYFQALNIPNLHVIGYDLLDENVRYLKQGIIALLIAQQPENQAYFSARDMCRFLIFNKKITKVNYMPIDILIKENIDDYQHFL